jgi:poly(A) polymerase
MACAASANSLMALSRERICDELMKILALPDPLATVKLMQENGIFASFLPEILDTAVMELGRLLDRERKILANPQFGRRLNAILPHAPEMMEKITARLKMSNRHRQELMLRAEQPNWGNDNIASAKAIAYKHGIALAQDICLLHANDDQWQNAWHALDIWTVPTFSIKGGDLIVRGLKAGPDVAACLQKVEGQWMEEDFPEKSRVDQIADQLVAAMLSIRNE